MVLDCIGSYFDYTTIDYKLYFFNATNAYIICILLSIIHLCNLIKTILTL